MQDQQNLLQNHIKNLIKINGAISVADFINEALFNPKYGYYQKKLPIGAKADFITAPEISQVFGELIAAYFLNIFINKYPNINENFSRKISFVEMGAGNGTLMYDILTTLKKFKDRKILPAQIFLEKIKFNIIEIGEELQNAQKQKLQDIIDEAKITINWYKNFSDFKKNNENAEIYFVANELFDCFAIHQFVKKNQNWHEIKITLQNDELVFVEDNFNEIIDKLVKTVLPLESAKIKDKALFEHSFSAINFMSELCQFLKKNGGNILIIDYGYFENPFKSSLQAVRNHQKQNIFSDIGNSDLTSLVNFSALQEIAQNHDLQYFISTQRDFLLSLGIEERRKILLQNKNQKEQEEINNAVDRLIHKDQMGELFKCLQVFC